MYLFDAPVIWESVPIHTSGYVQCCWKHVTISSATLWSTFWDKGHLSRENRGLSRILLILPIAQYLRNKYFSFVSICKYEASLIPIRFLHFLYFHLFPSIYNASPFTTLPTFNSLFPPRSNNCFHSLLLNNCSQSAVLCRVIGNGVHKSVQTHSCAKTVRSDAEPWNFIRAQRRWRIIFSR